MRQAEEPSTQLTDAERVELERLRQRVAALEAELCQQAATTNAIVARTQERVYWLDRWHVDLNALMARPGAAEFRAMLRAARWVARVPKRIRRRLAHR
jgi:hypothetical protein